MSVKYVAQEPDLDLDATVRENLLKAVAPIQAKIDRFNEVSMLMGDPGQEDNYDQLLEEMGQLQEEIDHVEGWELDHRIFPLTTLLLDNYLGVNVDALLSARHYSNNQTFFYLMNQRTISTQKLLIGLKELYAIIMAL